MPGDWLATRMSKHCQIGFPGLDGDEALQDELPADSCFSPIAVSIGNYYLRVLVAKDSSTSPS